MQKCNLGETTAMEGNLTCSGRTSAKIVTAAVAALASFKNPYDTTKKAVRVYSSAAQDTDVGFSSIKNGTATSITVQTCYVTKCSSADNRSTTELTVE